MKQFLLVGACVCLVSCSDYDFISKDGNPQPDTGDLSIFEPDLVASPESVSEIICASEEFVLSLGNEGKSALQIYDLLFDGEGWGLSETASFPVDIAPGEAWDVSITGGEGLTTLRVLSNDPDMPEKEIVLEGLGDQAPVPVIASPHHDSIVDIGVDLTLEGRVGDDVDAPEEIELSWVSSQDGLLYTGNADSSGIFSWQWPWGARSEGAHQIELVATDSCNNQAGQDISICQQAGYTVDQLAISTWHFEGAASWDTANSWLELTPVANSVVGSAFQTSTTVPADAVSIEFLFYIGDGDGADGLTLTALDTSRMGGYLGGNGCGIGYGGGAYCTAGPALPGWTIEVDTYYNGEQDPTPEDHVAFTFDGNLMTAPAWAVLPEMEDTGWHSMKVEVNAPHVLVQIDGVTYIDQNLSGNFNFPAYVGFTAGTGGQTNRHLIDSLEVTETICEE